jgi:hypothetical protein
MRPVAVATTLALALVLAACGSSSSQAPKPQTKLFIEIENFGKQVQVTVPEKVEAGVVDASFVNRTDGEHSAQLVKFDGDRAPADVLRIANAWGQGGKPLPGWLHPAGGFGVLKAGETNEGQFRLEPGKYLAIDLESEGRPVYSQFNVQGKPGDKQPPPGNASIKAAEYSFTATGLKSGPNEVLFDNTGEEPHMLAAAPLRKGATLADVRRFAKKEKGKSPLDDSKAVDLAVLDGGQRQTIRLDLQHGKYALLCFVPDRKGGPPHVAKGMISEAEVR